MVKKKNPNKNNVCIKERNRGYNNTYIKIEL